MAPGGPGWRPRRGRETGLPWRRRNVPTGLCTTAQKFHCGPKVSTVISELRSQASQKPCGSKASVALLARSLPTELEIGPGARIGQERGDHVVGIPGQTDDAADA